MDAASEIVRTGLLRALGFLLLFGVLVLLRAGIRGVTRWVRRRVRLPDRWRDPEWDAWEHDPPTRPAERHAQGLGFAILPLLFGLYRLFQGRFTLRTGGRSHPNPPVYLYEGMAAWTHAAGWLLLAAAGYLAFAGWPARDRRRRWGAVGLALGCFGAGFVLFACADAGAVKVR